MIDSQDDLDDPWGFYTFAERPEGWDSDGDGLPNWYEAVVGTDPESGEGDFSEMRSDPDGDGFTRMDDYLHWMATPHIWIEAGNSAEVDLRPLTRGFVDEPVFTIDETSAGETSLQNDGFTAEYSPAAGFNGIATFTFTVTDAEGDSMTRTFGVRVVPAE